MHQNTGEVNREHSHHIFLTSVCPSSTRSQAPLPRSQTRIVLSLDPEAKRPSESTTRENAACKKI